MTSLLSSQNIVLALGQQNSGQAQSQREHAAHHDIKAVHERPRRSTQQLATKNSPRTNPPQESHVPGAHSPSGQGWHPPVGPNGRPPVGPNRHPPIDGDFQAHAMHNDWLRRKQVAQLDWERRRREWRSHHARDRWPFEFTVFRFSEPEPHQPSVGGPLAQGDLIEGTGLHGYVYWLDFGSEDEGRQFSSSVTSDRPMQVELWAGRITTGEHSWWNGRSKLGGVGQYKQNDLHWTIKPGTYSVLVLWGGTLSNERVQASFSVDGQPCTAIPGTRR